MHVGEEERMWFVSALVENGEAAGTLHRFSMSAQNAAAAVPTTESVPADAASAVTAALFATHLPRYQAACAQMAVIQNTFVNTLATSAGSYSATEAANNRGRLILGA
jgi:hypothetical protein